MTRPRAFFQIDSSEELASEVVLQVGDVLRLNATGVIASEGSETVEIIGPLTVGALTSTQALLPAGGPNVSVIVMRKVGNATLDVIFGSAWGPHQTRKVNIRVERAS